jgi:hypothetical protein
MARNLYRLAIFIAIMATVFAARSPAMADWELLGRTGYKARLEQNIIDVGNTEGRYQAIGLEVTGSDVEIVDLRIVYGNGTSEELRVRQVFKAGSGSRRIALAGGDRFIRRIIVTYLPRGPFQLKVFGEPAQRWVELGCRSVGFRVDRDVIKVGRFDGAFRKIRLRVIGNKIEVFNLQVVYGNGGSDDIRVRAIIADGGVTKPLDLRGDRRAIQRIEMIYRSQPNFKGTAAVCVDGLSASL